MKAVAKRAPASSHKRSQRKRGQVLVRTVPLLLTNAVELKSGRPVSGRPLRDRVSWLAALVAAGANDTLSAHWDDAGIDVMAGGAQFAYKQLERTLGLPALPQGAVAIRRVRWMAGELAGRQLRSAAYRRQIYRALLADDLSLLSRGADPVSLRNLRRKLNSYERANGQAAASLFELEPQAPRVPALVPLAATDDQLCRLSLADEEGRFTLDVSLPLVSQPQSYSDWGFHRFELQLPLLYQDRQPCRPTLRIKGKRLLADVPVELEAPEPILAGAQQPSRVLAADWGVNTLLTATLAWQDSSGHTATDGRPLVFNATPLTQKAYRLQDQINSLTAKLAHYTELLGVKKGSRPEEIEELLALTDSAKEAGLIFPPLRASQGQELITKHAQLWQERRCVSDKLSHLSQEIAHLASRWLIEQAVALGVEAIVLEDLATLEAGGLGKKQNRRVSLQVRGLLLKQIEAKAAEVGLRVILVDARGTSSFCPRCGGKAKHVRASNDSRSGHAWKTCPGCGHQASRDHSAAERIAQRALTPKVEKVRPERQPRRERETLSPLTLPKRGTKAKSGRDLLTLQDLDSFFAAQRASSAASPPQPAPPTGHRSAGTLAQGLAQPRTTSTCRPARRLNGMRSAYKEQLSCTPVRTVYPAARAVTTG